MPQLLTEWKAGKIKDPVARLRYLQRKIGPGTIPTLPRRTRWKAAALLPALACLFIPGFKASNSDDELLPPPIPHLTAVAVDVFTDVWLVEKSHDVETYSNGLLIDDRYAVSSDPRIPYSVFGQNEPISTQTALRTQPAGIVYHTTESDQASFEENQNRALKRIGKEVLTFVRRNRCYHFVIDRFGQVFRIVEESDIANHAGNSVWADARAIYVNLNSSFLGVAFETQSQPGELPSATPAQIHSARVLTQMLRSKYRIPEANCVTHAQVSVNPDNMLVGYHTDWSGNFPFLEVGLHDNYPAPPAAIYAFGFDYDPVFVHRTGLRLWQGLAVAEDQLRTQATAQGLRPAQYRSLLRKHYKEIITTLKAASAKEERHAT
ncbi:MAG TPA: peptidoglycan recognition family protein [Bryobacteraceae bacterium]|nr:peptidoglycan recognition family protein [Bryobacteraceae bacterium]